MPARKKTSLSVGKPAKRLNVSREPTKISEAPDTKNWSWEKEKWSINTKEKLKENAA